MLLSELPVEIVLIIFKSVKNKADFASLAACSRLFAKVATPLLLAEIGRTRYLWEVEYDENDKRLNRPGDTTQKLRNLTLTILRCLYLATFVYSLNLSWSRYPVWRRKHNVTRENFDQTMWIGLDLGPFLDAVTALTFPGDAKNQDDRADFCRQWRGALGALSSDAYLEFLLAYLPSLRTLEIDVTEDSCNGIIFEMLHCYSGRKDACGTTPILGSLTHLYMYGVEQDSASTARLPIELPRIPSLCHFYGFKLGVIELDEEYCAKNGSFTSLVYLNLGMSSYGSHGLQHILRQCICLQTLAFQHEWRKMCLRF